MNKLAEFVDEKLKEKYIQTSVKVEIETPYRATIDLSAPPDFAATLNTGKRKGGR